MSIIITLALSALLFFQGFPCSYCKFINICSCSGPALLLARDDTISAYDTPTALLIAETMGTVTCPAQVTKFTLSKYNKFSSKFTAGTQKGPTAAGVKSRANIPGFAWCSS